MANLVPDIPPLVGQAPAFLDLMEQVSRVAPLDRPVLVIGERGTGKELIAARLHYLSPRWDRPLLKLNAAALPETLLDSELFGHEAGAFTGALRQRRGRFELADGGSLFLDEIASTSLAVQERLLRVVEYGAFERVGGSTTVQVDVRLIGATNVDLPAAAADGHFRHDLLDRLAFDVLTVPPLRARREDIAVARRAFRARHGAGARLAEVSRLRPRGAGRAVGARVARQRARAEERGGARGVSRGIAATADRRGSSSIPSPRRSGRGLRLPRPARAAPEPAAAADRTSGCRRRLPGQTAPSTFAAAVAAFERRLLEETLARHRHNQRTTAAKLNLSYDQLRHQLRKHGLLQARP